MRVFTIVFALLLMFGGCADKSYVKIVDDSIDGDIDVESITDRVREDGLKEVQVMGENDTDEYMLLRYRVTWQDKDGFEVPSISSHWTELPVHKNAAFSINVIAPNATAQEYQVYINKQGE